MDIRLMFVKYFGNLKYFMALKVMRIRSGHKKNDKKSGC